jgi:hypothetical protein
MQGVQTLSTRAALCMALVLATGNSAKSADGISTSFNGISTTISGYGTVGGTFTSDNRYTYVHDPTEFQGAGTQFDAELDSRIGLQAIVDFGSGFSVTAQELGRERGNDAFSLGTEWLFAQYAPDSDWKFRLGRVALSTFLFSDSREVGYAAPWFHAPNEVYSAEVFQYLDGGQVLWHHNLGSFGLGLEGSYGSSTEPFEAFGAQFTVKARNMGNVAATLQYRDFSLRLARTTMSISQTLPLTPTFSVSYDLKDTFDSAGLQYDNGTAIVLSEFAKRSQNSAPVVNVPLADSNSWYVAGGWRFGKLTPLLIYGSFNPRQSLAYTNANDASWSASVRYDVVRDVALKAQISRPQARNEAYWITPSPSSDQRVTVFSLGADFVF